MRIRRLASKILGTALSAQPPASPQRAGVDDSSNGYFCEFNQSPWDVFPWHYPQEFEENEIAEDGIHGEVMSAVTSIAAVPNIELTAASSEESPGIQEKLVSKPKQALKKVKTLKGKTETVKKDVEYVKIVDPFTCKKTDGKQWQCRRPADKPNSFCNYHQEKHRFYDKKKAKAPASMTPNRRNQTARKTASPPVVADSCEDSVSEAWQGKPQGEGDIDCLVSAALEVIKEQSKTEEALKCNLSNVTFKNDSNVNVNEESSEDIDEEEKQRTLNIDISNPQSRKKKRRKPVKERSLASLLM